MNAAKSSCYAGRMNSQLVVGMLSGSDLLARTRDLARQSCAVEADLLVHLAEIDERKLYLECALPSMFAFCVDELGFSEDAAYYRIHVARAARRMPAIIDTIRTGKVHLAGVRLLAPHLTVENHVGLLAEADGKSKRQIEEIVARVAPQPAVPTLVSKVIELCAPAAATLDPAPSPLLGQPQAPEPRDVPEPVVSRTHVDAHRAEIRPLSEEMFKIQFTATRAFRDKLREAQGLLRHRIPDGDVARTLEMALDLLIEKVKKERFATGRKPRATSLEPTATSSRHVPDAIKRAVYERDGGRCTFKDDRGRRCPESGALEFDHVDGFALTHLHDVDRIRLLCRAHNQRAADQMYGHAFMDGARRSRGSTRPGARSRPQAPG